MRYALRWRGIRWGETWSSWLRFRSAKAGRKSNSIAPEHLDTVLAKTAPDRMHNYIVLSC